MQQLAHRLPRRGWHIRKWLRIWRKEHRRALRYAAVVLLALVALIEIVQLIYPSGRLLPFASVGGQDVGGSTIKDAAQQLDRKYTNASITLKTDSKQFTTSFIDAGVSVDTTQAAEDAASYPFWQRIIPLSLLVGGALRDTPAPAYYDDAKLTVFATKVQQEGHSVAVNATLAVKEGKVALVPSTPTKDYPADTVTRAIKNADLSPRATLRVAPRTTPAPLNDDEAKSMLGEVQKLVDDGLIFTLQGKEIQTDKRVKGAWLTFAADASNQRLEIGLNNDLVKKYLESIQGDAYKAPGTTRVQLIDDREVSRAIGASGRGVDMDKAVAAIDKAVKAAGSDTIALAITDLQPVLAYDKKYSNTDQALATLVSQTASSKGGYGISVMELDGRSAHANGTKQFVAASTYKLYVAYAVIKEVEAGRLSWSGTISGKTVAKCFDDMIVVSDNPCAVAFGKLIGWQAITDMMHGLGLSASTRLGSGMYTTANDLSYFLYRVQNGSILSGEGRDRLIGAMKRQSYTRAGIPSGVSGTVADKVGDVDGYLHDAAIVYGTHRTYILVVMTSGSSWSGIADAARQVGSFVDK